MKTPRNQKEYQVSLASAEHKSLVRFNVGLSGPGFYFLKGGTL
jgi:hypothetical protein